MSYFTDLVLISFQAETVSHLSLCTECLAQSLGFCRCSISLPLFRWLNGNTTSHRLQMVIRQNNKHCKHPIFSFNYYYFCHFVIKPGKWEMLTIVLNLFAFPFKNIHLVSSVSWALGTGNRRKTDEPWTTEGVEGIESTREDRLLRK